MRCYVRQTKLRWSNINRSVYTLLRCVLSRIIVGSISLSRFYTPTPHMYDNPPTAGGILGYFYLEETKHGVYKRHTRRCHTLAVSMWEEPAFVVNPAGLATRTGTAAASTATASRSPGAARDAAAQRKVTRASATSAGGPRTMPVSSFELRPNG